jgi:hypothetical protein
MRTFAAVIGVLCLLLGGLWFLQGLDVVHVRPILCVADCVPLQGPSTTWAVAGLVALVAGILLIRYARRERARR